MNGYERTVKFVNGEKVDRPPFMPLAIEWVSKQNNLDYQVFVYDPMKRAQAYLKTVEEFHFDCVLPDADFYEQLEDFGFKPVFSDSGYHADPLLTCPDDVHKLAVPTFASGTRMGNRLDIIKEIAKTQKGVRYIFGPCIGPFTEYTNARGVEDGLCEFLEDPDEMLEGLKFFNANCLKFIEKQLDAGADGIQIVEPSCSLVSPAMYEEYVLPLHKELVDMVQARTNGFARLHICGDTTRLQPYSLASGTRILDCDYQVDLAACHKNLGPDQCFCGNINPAGELLQGQPEDFKALVRKIYTDSQNRCIISAGCDVPPDTSVENMIAFYEATVALAE